jgi:hypothetical protein
MALGGPTLMVWPCRYSPTPNMLGSWSNWGTYRSSLVLFEAWDQSFCNRRFTHSHLASMVETNAPPPCISDLSCAELTPEWLPAISSTTLVSAPNRDTIVPLMLWLWCSPTMYNSPSPALEVMWVDKKSPHPLTIEPGGSTGPTAFGLEVGTPTDPRQMEA